jgi:hypothetical protein
MSVQRIYRSKVDSRIALVTGLVLVVLLVTGTTLPGPSHISARFTHILLLLPLAFCVWTLIGTYYVVDTSSLIAYSGPFHWTIPLRDIRSVRSSRDLRSGPALSLDRLRVEFGQGRVLMISPREKEDFLADLVHRGVQGVES